MTETRAACPPPPGCHSAPSPAGRVAGQWVKRVADRAVGGTAYQMKPAAAPQGIRPGVCSEERWTRRQGPLRNGEAMCRFVTFGPAFVVMLAATVALLGAMAGSMDVGPFP